MFWLRYYNAKRSCVFTMLELIPILSQYGILQSQTVALFYPYLMHAALCRTVSHAKVCILSCFKSVDITQHLQGNVSFSILFKSMMSSNASRNLALVIC